MTLVVVDERVVWMLGVDAWVLRLGVDGWCGCMVLRLGIDAWHSCWALMLGGLPDVVLCGMVVWLPELLTCGMGLWLPIFVIYFSSWHGGVPRCNGTVGAWLIYTWC